MIRARSGCATGWGKTSLRVYGDCHYFAARENDIIWGQAGQREEGA